MIGYYVHHVGSGHLQHARILARHVRDQVTGLSSLPRPAGWQGDWVRLPRDDATTQSRDPQAGGLLHWAPLQDPGLRHRMAAVARWIARACPNVLVADVSVEIALLARLHGIPVVSVVLPGRRGDPPHRLGYGVSTRLVAPWPSSARTMLSGLAAADAQRVTHVGALSRFPPRDGDTPEESGTRRVALLCGSGGGGPTPAQIASARAQTPGWEWSVIGADGATWVEDPSEILRHAQVVVAQTGLGSVADIAASRRPAVLVPGRRPHDEQSATGFCLSEAPWPTVVLDRWPPSGWAERLGRASRLDGSAWSGWYDGRGGERFAAVVECAGRKP